MTTTTKPAKPRLHNRVISMYGYKAKERAFSTDCGLHSAMKDYARAMDVRRTLLITTTFDDGSTDIERLYPCTKTITYKDYEGESWEEGHYYGKSWDCDNLLDKEKLTTKQVVKELKSWMDTKGIGYKSVDYEVLDFILC